MGTFFRAKGQAAQRQGSGRGLAIVKNLVELMRGEVHLESAVGKGTTLCLSIPARLADEARIQAREARLAAPPPAPEPAPAAATPGSMRIRLLLVRIIQERLRTTRDSVPMTMISIGFSLVGQGA